MTAIPENRKIKYPAQIKGITPGGGGVESVTGISVDNTDPLNPVIRPNPAAYVFDPTKAECNPDATGGGSIVIDFHSSSIASMSVGDTVEMELNCYVDTRNAVDLISSINWGTASSGSVNIGAEGWNLSNNLVGFFTIKQSCTRTDSTAYKVINTFEIRTDSGVEIIKSGSLNIAGASGGAISPTVSVVFVEADANNKFELISGVILVYIKNQP